MNLVIVIAVYAAISKELGRPLRFPGKPSAYTATLAKAGEEYKEIGAQMSPFKRLGQPEEIADAIAFLVSEQARWITGANIQAGGGVV